MEYEVPLRTLILGTSPHLEFPVEFLSSVGCNFDIFNESSTEHISSWLYDKDGNPRYNSFIFTDANLGVVSKHRGYHSLLSPEEWDEVHSYQIKYHARSVSLASSYLVDEAIIPAEGWEQGTSNDVQLSFIISEPFVQHKLSGVKPTATFTIGNINKFLRVDGWYYPSYINKNDPSISNAHIKPIMVLNSINANGSVNNENWLGAFIKKKSGREEMHFMVTASQYGHYSFVLADVWLPWLYQGLLLGQRRRLLDTQIDDIFLSTLLYNVTNNAPGVDGLGKTYTATAEDFKRLIAFQREVNNHLPTGSRFVFQLAFNGFGLYEDSKSKKALRLVIQKFKNEFFWVSHTWSHKDLHCPFSDCKKYGITNYLDAYEEVLLNAEMATEDLFWEFSKEELSSCPIWSPTSLVTPRISGLNNSQAVEAILDNGIYYVVGDNSRPELVSAFKYHMAHSVQDNKKRFLRIIPRFPTRIYFDVSIPEEAEKEHNSIYGPHCIGYDSKDPVEYPNKCNLYTFKFNNDLNMSDIIEMDAFEVARNLLRYDPAPYMFHQANMRFFDYENKETCLLCMWIEAVIAYINSYSTLPILTYKMDDLAEIYALREERDKCDIEVFVTYDDNDNPTQLRLTSKNICTAKITQTTGFKKYFKSSHFITHKERYGPDKTVDIYLDGSTRILYFDDQENIPYERELPYPPAVTPTGRVKKETLSPQEFILQRIFEVDNNLRTQIGNYFKFINEFVSFHKGAQCYWPELLKNLNLVSETFSKRSLPVEVAKSRGENSYYLMMEESFLKLVPDIENFLTEKMGVKITKDLRYKIHRHVLDGWDKNENFASDYIKAQYEQLQTLEKRLLKSGPCQEE